MREALLTNNYIFLPANCQLHRSFAMLEAELLRRGLCEPGWATATDGLLRRQVPRIFRLTLLPILALSRSLAS